MRHSPKIAHRADLKPIILTWVQIGLNWSQFLARESFSQHGCAFEGLVHEDHQYGPFVGASFPVHCVALPRTLEPVVPQLEDVAAGHVVGPPITLRRIHIHAKRRRTGVRQWPKSAKLGSLVRDPEVATSTHCADERDTGAQEDASDA